MRLTQNHGVFRPTENSEGERITLSVDHLSDFWQWFGESVVVDHQGRPLVVYRGEHGPTSTPERFQSRQGCLSFGSAKAARVYASAPNDRSIDLFAQAPRIFAAYLKLERPLLNDPKDPFVDLGKFREIIGSEPMHQVVSEFSNYIMHTSNWIENFEEFSDARQVAEQAPERLDDLYFEAYALLDSIKWAERVKVSGFDGAIHCGSGETACEPEYKVFTQAQTWIISSQIIDAR